MTSLAACCEYLFVFICCCDFGFFWVSKTWMLFALLEILARRLEQDRSDCIFNFCGRDGSA